MTPAPHLPREGPRRAAWRPARRLDSRFAGTAAALILLLCFWTAAAADRTHAAFANIDRHLSELSRITGLRAHKKIDPAVISREDVNSFLKERVKEVSSPQELRAEELALKKLGLVPADFDAAKSLVDLYTEQAVALYDFHRKKLYLTQSVSTPDQEWALVHELAHALADQNFNLERYLKQARDSDDASLARMAVMEGQATWLMTEYQAQKAGLSLSTETVSAMARMTGAPAGQFPVFEQAPLYLRETMIFPYTKGLLFQHAVFEKMGRQAFAEVFRRPPVSTQQILHPDTYFSGRAPTSPPLPAFSQKGFKRLVEGTIGELDHSILLTQYTSQVNAAELAPRWRGGRYAVHENRDRSRAVLAYAVEWDSPAAAADYFKSYRQVLERKWKKLEIASEAAGELRGNGDDGRFVLKHEGSVVTSLEGLP